MAGASPVVEEIPPWIKLLSVSPSRSFPLISSGKKLIAPAGVSICIVPIYPDDRLIVIVEIRVVPVSRRVVLAGRFVRVTLAMISITGEVINKSAILGVCYLRPIDLERLQVNCLRGICTKDRFTCNNCRGGMSELALQSIWGSKRWRLRIAGEIRGTNWAER